jgi:hypothetical protein
MSALPIVAMLAVALVVVPSVWLWRRSEGRARRENVERVRRRMRREIAGLSVEELKQRIRESGYFRHVEEGGALRETRTVRQFFACLDGDDYCGCAGALGRFVAAERSIGCTHAPMIEDFDIAAMVDELAARAPHPFR